MMTLIMGVMAIIAICIGGSMEDRLIITPTDEVVGYLNRSLVFRCDQPEALALERVDWFVNGINVRDLYDLFSYSTRSIGLSSSVLVINKAVLTLNSSVIHCEGITSTQWQSSPKVTLRVQGLLHKVELLDVVVSDYYLSITWVRPFTLDPNESIVYSINVTNHTSNDVSTTMLYTTVFELLSTNRRITCDSLTFTITPHNLVGKGVKRIIADLYTAVSSSGFEIINSNNADKMDLLITLSDPICEITNLQLSNVYVNDNIQLDSDYYLTDIALGSYTYYLTLNLDKRFWYTLNMILKNSIGSNTASFNISTFAVKNISIVAEQNRIDIGIEKYSYATNDDVGVFIILLRCENDYCKNYDYSNSIFLSIYNKNNGSHDAEFNEGYYLPLAFETTSNGALLVSFNNTCLPAVKDVDRFYLTSSLIGDSWNTNTHCDINYNNNSVRSECNLTNNNLGQQILLLIKSVYGNIPIIIAGNTTQSKITCFSYCLEFYVALTNQVSNSSNEQLNKPIGFTVFSENSSSTDLQDNLCEVQDDLNLWVQLVFILLLPIILAISITLLILMLLVRKKKNEYWIRKLSKNK